jgi:dihydroorotate dehydrogenase (NAD+) catalytic subunit
VGGISSAQDAIAMLMAGANAVEIGTASFADPRAPWRIQRAMRRWMRHHHESTLVDIIGRSHG